MSIVRLTAALGNVSSPLVRKTHALFSEYVRRVDLLQQLMGQLHDRIIVSNDLAVNVISDDVEVLELRKRHQRFVTELRMNLEKMYGVSFQIQELLDKWFNLINQFTTTREQLLVQLGLVVNNLLEIYKEITQNEGIRILAQNILILEKQFKQLHKDWITAGNDVSSKIAAVQMIEQVLVHSTYPSIRELSRTHSAGNDVVIKNLAANARFIDELYEAVESHRVAIAQGVRDIMAVMVQFRDENVLDTNFATVFVSDGTFEKLLKDYKKTHDAIELEIKNFQMEKEFLTKRDKVVADALLLTKPGMPELLAKRGTIRALAGLGGDEMKTVIDEISICMQKTGTELKECTNKLRGVKEKDPTKIHTYMEYAKMQSLLSNKKDFLNDLLTLLSSHLTVALQNEQYKMMQHENVHEKIDMIHTQKIVNALQQELATREREQQRRMENFAAAQTTISEGAKELAKDIEAEKKQLKLQQLLSSDVPPEMSSTMTGTAFPEGDGVDKDVLDAANERVNQRAKEFLKAKGLSESRGVFLGTEMMPRMLPSVPLFFPGGSSINASMYNGGDMEGGEFEFTGGDDLKGLIEKIKIESIAPSNPEFIERKDVYAPSIMFINGLLNNKRAQVNAYFAYQKAHATDAIEQDISGIAQFEAAIDAQIDEEIGKKFFSTDKAINDILIEINGAIDALRAREKEFGTKIRNYNQHVQDLYNRSHLEHILRDKNILKNYPTLMQQANAINEKSEFTAVLTSSACITAASIINESKEFLKNPTTKVFRESLIADTVSKYTILVKTITKEYLYLDKAYSDIEVNKQGLFNSINTSTAQLKPGSFHAADVRSIILNLREVNRIMFEQYALITKLIENWYILVRYSDILQEISTVFTLAPTLKRGCDRCYNWIQDTIRPAIEDTKKLPDLSKVTGIPSV